MDTPAFQRLRRHFGDKVDADVLVSVLGVCGGSAEQAITFLTAGAGDLIEDTNANPNDEKIPADYPAQNPSGIKPRPAPTEEVLDKDLLALHANIAQIKKSLLSDCQFSEHYKGITSENYVVSLLLLLYQGVELAKGARPRILAACWARQQRRLAAHLLSDFSDQFSLPEVLGAVKLLDANRKVKILNTKLAKFTGPKAQDPKAVALRQVLHDVKLEAIEGTSVSGSLSREICKWVGTITAEQLCFYALQLPKEPWKELADIVHLSPNSFQVPWFLPVVFGKDPPTDCVVSLCQDLTPQNIVQILSQGHKIPYSYLRTHCRPIPPRAKVLIAEYVSIDILIWWHEEFDLPEVDKIITERLAKGEIPNFTYGKLMERLLYFKRRESAFYNALIPIAEKRLASIELLLEPPVVVLGDASYSMDVAIRTATIISSVLTVLSSAELKFFNTTLVDPPCHPTNVGEVISVAETVKASGLTASASAIWPYYQKKTPVKFFIVVTDEIENNKFENRCYFPEVFLKYYQEVYPAKLVFVSFVEDPSKKGRMVKSLENMGLDILQFRLDGTRPDLTKMDSLLGLLSSESSFFPTQVVSLSLLYQKEGLDNLIHRIKNPPEKKIQKRIKIQKEESSEDDVAVPKKNPKYDDAPAHFCCPITLAPMKDPVMSVSGQSYEREAIESYIKKAGKDPMTSEPLTLGDLRPNRGLREAIEAYLVGKK